MAGLGSRFQNSHPGQFKPFIDVLGRPMIEQVILNNNHADNTKFIFITRDDLPVDQLIKICDKLYIDYTIISIDYVTQGAACTCLLAKEFIYSETPLIITNCDQITEDLNINNIVKFAKYNNSDGILGVFKSNSNKNSYVKLNSKFEVIEVKEKIVISDIATTGFHFWKSGSMFVESANDMINNNERYNNEFYVAPTYNHLIAKNKKIHPYYFNLHFPIGTPEDLNKYIQHANIKY